MLPGATKKKIIMRSEFARTALGESLLSKFGDDNVRFGPSLQGDLIIPGPPISTAFLVLEHLTSQRLQSQTGRLERLSKMFQHSIVILVSPKSEAVSALQSRFPKCDRLLIFPDAGTVAGTVFNLAPLLSSADRRSNQQRFVQQVRGDAMSSAAVAPLLASRFGISETHANLLLDRFGTLSGVIAFGRQHSFRTIVRECPIGTETADRLSSFFGVEPPLLDAAGAAGTAPGGHDSESSNFFKDGLDYSSSFGDPEPPRHPHLGYVRFDNGGAPADTNLEAHYHHRGGHDAAFEQQQEQQQQQQQQQFYYHQDQHHYHQQQQHHHHHNWQPEYNYSGRPAQQFANPQDVHNFGAYQ